MIGSSLLSPTPILLSGKFCPRILSLAILSQNFFYSPGECNVPLSQTNLIYIFLHNFSFNHRLNIFLFFLTLIIIIFASLFFQVYSFLTCSFLRFHESLFYPIVHLYLIRPSPSFISLFNIFHSFIASFQLP